MRHGIVPVLAIVLAAAIAGCGGQTAPASKQEAPKKIFRIAFSQCNSAEPYRTAQNNIMKRDIAKYPDCQLTIQDAQQDNAKQIAQIENFIQQGIDVLIVAPNEAAPLTAAVKKAKDKGIKVVCLERNLLEPVYDIFVGADNVKIGEMAGQFVAEYVSGKGIQNPVVVEMKGLLGTKPQEERHNGARKYIDGIAGVKVIEDVASWIQNESLKRMETILQANPKIDVVYAHNDPMAVGAYWAAKNAGREKDMIFVGVDALGGPDGGIKRVLDGMLACTFYYPTCAAEGLEFAVKLAHGEPVVKEKILEPARITKDNAQEWYDKVTVQ
ncbi:MAG: substrate-binding domain-containing protein [Candidatus Hydrogenedentes bacterium]|nr:substrate-binding domain-containing protein [Candidatus Hydrogenedentota bacterium]